MFITALFLDDLAGGENSAIGGKINTGDPELMREVSTPFP